MGETGVVISKKEDLVEVKMKRSPACEKCKACIALTSSSNEMVLHAKNICNADVGDTVTVELQQSGFFKAIAIMYAVPLAALIFGFLLGFYGAVALNMDNIKEIAGFLLGAGFTTLTYLLINKKEEHWKQTMPKPFATSVVENEIKE